MEEQLELLNKLENEYGVIFQEFESTPTCVKCGHEDDQDEGEHGVRYISGIYFTDEEDNEEHFGFEHLTLTCPACGYSFRSLTKDVQEAYEESLQEAEDELPEEESDDNLFDGQSTTEIAIELGSPRCRHRRLLPDDEDQGRTVEEPELKPKKPSKLTKMFFEEKKEE